MSRTPRHGNATNDIWQHCGHRLSSPKRSDTERRPTLPRVVSSVAVFCTPSGSSLFFGVAVVSFPAVRPTDNSRPTASRRRSQHGSNRQRRSEYYDDNVFYRFKRAILYRKLFGRLLASACSSPLLLILRARATGSNRRFCGRRANEIIMKKKKEKNKRITRARKRVLRTSPQGRRRRYVTIILL